MSDEEIVWHYKEFDIIQIWVEEKMEKNNLNPHNVDHAEQIKEIIRDTVIEFKRWI